jgi:hypothetical protein
VTAHHIFVGIVQGEVQSLEFRHALQSLCQLMEQFGQGVVADHQVGKIKQRLIAVKLVLRVEVTL